MIKNDMIFKFVSLRAPVADRERDEIGRTIISYGSSVVDETELPIMSIARGLHGTPGAHIAMLKKASEVMTSDQYIFNNKNYKASITVLDHIVLIMERCLEMADKQELINKITAVIDSSIQEYVKHDRYKKLKMIIWDSLYTNIVAPDEKPEDRDKLYGYARALSLLDMLSKNEETTVCNINLLRIGTIFVDPAVFPKPDTSNVKTDEEMEKNDNAEVQDFVKKREGLYKALKDIDSIYRKKRKELLSEKCEPRQKKREKSEKSEKEQVDDDLYNTSCKINEDCIIKVSPNKGKAIIPWRISKDEISKETQKILEENNISTDLDDITAYEEIINQQISMITSQLHNYTLNKIVRKIGNSPVYVPATNSKEYRMITAQKESTKCREKEVQKHVPPEKPYNIIGIGDLLVVKEKLLRYETGEIAHIENVLQGESKNRKHTRVRETEEIEEFEREQSEEDERSLESTERFELQKESKKSIEEEMSVEAGVNISASYGFVQVEASGNFAYNTSRSEANRSASQYAQSVTEKSVSRIKEQVREKRVVRTLQKIEEINEHGLNNSNGAGHIRGVFQWLDKTYEVQIINYGKRLMLEFVVPEPAAFYIHAMKNNNQVNVAMEEPKTLKELGLNTHKDIKTNNEITNSNTEVPYDFYIAEYQVQDVTPPPFKWIVVSMAINQDYLPESRMQTKAINELVIPEGYRASSAVITPIDVATDSPAMYGKAIVGNITVPIHYAGQTYTTLNYEDTKLPVSIISNVYGYIMNIEVVCDRRDEHFENWQLKTYNSIVDAYRARKAEYDEQITAARFQQGITIEGRNPANNRKIEKNEFKKGCITLLTGSRFEEYGSISENSAPFDQFPEIDEAQLLLQKNSIQFIEQAFEWDQMTYLFYPYYWGRKEHWLDIFPLEDIDPKFEDFLRSGAARVIVPVHPSYNGAVIYFLASNGTPWNGGPAPTILNPLFRSISEELKNHQDPGFIQGKGLISVTNGRRIVQLHGPAFFTDDNVNRQIRIKDMVYIIEIVNSNTQITLNTPYAGQTENDIPFDLGPWRVGLPWKVKVPTSLVYVKETGELPVYE